MSSQGMDRVLNILILEDRADDAELMMRQLGKSGFTTRWVRVDTEEEFVNQLRTQPDVVFADYNLPNFDPLKALKLVRDHDPFLPFILVSGSVGEERAVEIIKLGATDYLLKDRLARLGTATKRALQEQHLLQEKQKAAEQLKRALAAAEAARDQTLAILRSASDGLIVTDTQNRLVLISRAAEPYFPDSCQDFSGRPVDELIRPSALQAYFRQAAQSSQHSPPTQLELADSDRLPRYVQLQTSTVVNKQGSCTGWITTLRDVTREREIDNLKNDFISTAAHELLTPLTSVLGYSELLLSPDGLDPEVQQECLGYIHQKALNLAEIVDDLLDLGRIEVGKTLPLNRAPCDLASELTQLIEQSRRLFPEREFTLELPQPPFRPELDRGKLIQALENLLSNAIKYSPEGSPVRLRSWVDTQRLNIAVSDQGIGMTRAQAEKAFEKFFRGDSSNTAAGGLGIGLTITKNIMDAHGGEIRICSQPGAGTTITLTFPLSP